MQRQTYEISLCRFPLALLYTEQSFRSFPIAHKYLEITGLSVYKIPTSSEHNQIQNSQNTHKKVDAGIF